LGRDLSLLMPSISSPQHNPHDQFLIIAPKPPKRK
jgi:hypothetical protein